MAKGVYLHGYGWGKMFAMTGRWPITMGVFFAVTHSVGQKFKALHHFLIVGY